MKKYIAILCVLIFFFIITYSKEEIGYGFPLIREDVEKVVLEQGLKWETIEERSDEEGHSLYMFYDDNDDYSYINSYAFKEQKYLTLYKQFSKDSESDEIKEFNDYWSDMFEVSGQLYGNTHEVKKVYREFLNYIKKRSILEDDYVYFTKRIGDTHFRARSYFRKDYNISLYSYYFEISNSESYEKRAFLPAKAILESLEKQGVKVFDGINVSDLKNINSVDESYRLVVRGHLENIKEIKLMTDELNILSNYYGRPAFEGDYYTAKLVDDTGSIDVYLLSTSLTTKELKEERNHHVNYLCKEKISIIVSSPLIE